MASGPAAHLLQPLHTPTVSLTADVTPDEVIHLQEVEDGVVAEVGATTVTPDEVDHLQEVDEGGATEPGGDVPAFAGTATSVGVDSTGTTTDITKPGGVGTGVLAFIIVDTYHASATDASGTTVSGFTKVGTETILAGNNSHTKSMFWRMCDGSEGSTFTITHHNNPFYVAGTCQGVTGAHTTTPINAFDFETSTIATSAVPQVTTTVPNCLVVTNKIGNTATSFTAPSGYSPAWTYDSSFGHVWSKTQAGTGLTGTPTSGHVANNVTSLTFAIAPTSGGDVDVTPDDVDHLQEVEDGGASAEATITPDEVIHLQEVLDGAAVESGTGGAPLLTGTPSSYGADTAGTTSLIPYPTGIVLGELLLAICDVYHVAAADATGMTLAGFTVIPTPLENTSGNQSHTKGVFYRIATGSETGTATLTHISNPTYVSGSIVRIASQHASSPINAIAYAVSTTADSACPQVTTTADNCLVITAKTGYNATAFATPATYADAWIYDSNFAEVWSKTQALAGVTGTPTVTHVADPVTSMTIAIRGTGTGVGGTAVTPDEVIHLQNVTTSGLGGTGEFQWPTSVAPDNVHILDQNGDPWLMRGDAAWSLFVRLNLADAEQYLEDRAARGVNLVLVELIEHFFATSPPNNLNGDAPFTGTAFQSSLNEAYWSHVDDIMDIGESLGISFMCYPSYLGFLTTEQGWDTELAAASNVQAAAYGTAVGERYADRPNIMWVAGGDQNPDATLLARTDAMMVALTTAAPFLTTAHSGPLNSADGIFGAYSWLTIDSVYANTAEADDTESVVSNTPTRPLFMIEGRGENCPNPAVAQQHIRRQHWLTILAGSRAGSIFMNNPVWHFGLTVPPALFPYPGTWQSNLNSTGAIQFAILMDFISVRPWYDWAPDTGDTFLTGGQGTGTSQAVASFSPELGIVYTPVAKTFTVDLAEIAEPRNVYWLDPTSGDTQVATGTGSFTTPGTNDGGDTDWALVVESAAVGSFPATIDADSRHILDQDGNRWIMRGDSGWSIFAQLSLADAQIYLNDRAAKGYNTILCSLIEHHFADDAPNNVNGDAPFVSTAFQTAINDAYFDHVDAIITYGASVGITFLICPAYFGFNGGSEGWGAEVQAASNAQMTTYGTSIGTRYASYPNIIWCAGGDWNGNATALARHNSMMLAIQAAAPAQLRTAHAAPGFDAADIYNSYSWFQVNNVYGTTTQALTVDEVQGEYGNAPTRPLFYIEGRYENEPSPGDPQLKFRKQAWGSILAGCTAGTIFGNNPVWHFDAPNALFPSYPGTWQSNLNSTGNTAMGILWDFLTTHDWETLAPDTAVTFLTGGIGTGTNECAAAFHTGLGVVYTPVANTLIIDLTEISGTLTAQWLDPTSGDLQTATPSGSNFATPGNNDAGDPDWVLVLEGDVVAPGATNVIPADVTHLQEVDVPAFVEGALVPDDSAILQVVDAGVVSIPGTSTVVPNDCTTLQVVDATTATGTILPADVVHLGTVDTGSAHDPTALKLNITFTAMAPQLVPGAGTPAAEGPSAPVFVSRQPGAPMLAPRSSEAVLFHGNPGEPVI